MKPLLQLAQTTTDDDLLLNGLYARGYRDRLACIYIHGFGSDFYSRPLYHSLADALLAQGNSLVLAQHRGTGLRTEFQKSTGVGISIGSLYERLEDAHYDISAWIKWLIAEGHDEIALIGHSVGTIKVIRYLFEGAYADKVKRLVLLAPFDKNAYLEHLAPNKWREYLASAESKVAAGKGDEVVSSEYEQQPMSSTTFVSWYHSDELNEMFDFYRPDYEFPILSKISVPVKAIIGDQDICTIYPEFDVSPASAMEILEKRIPQCESTVIPGVDHVFSGFETEVAKEISSALQI